MTRMGQATMQVRHGWFTHPNSGVVTGHSLGMWTARLQGPVSHRQINKQLIASPSKKTHTSKHSNTTYPKTISCHSRLTTQHTTQKNPPCLILMCLLMVNNSIIQPYRDTAVGFNLQPSDPRLKNGMCFASRPSGHWCWDRPAPGASPAALAVGYHM